MLSEMAHPPVLTRQPSSKFQAMNEPLTTEPDPTDDRTRVANVLVENYRPFDKLWSGGLATGPSPKTPQEAVTRTWLGCRTCLTKGWCRGSTGCAGRENRV
jgi:hypothetical protein